MTKNITILILWLKKSKIKDLKFLKVFKNVENLKNHHEVGEIIIIKKWGVKKKKINWKSKFLI